MTLPRVRPIERPLHIVMVPSVARIGETPRYAMTNPLISPTIAPTAKPAMSAIACQPYHMKPCASGTCRVST